MKQKSVTLFEAKLIVLALAIYESYIFIWEIFATTRKRQNVLPNEET